MPLSFTYPPEDSYFYENFFKNPEIPNENGWLEVSFLWMNDMKQLLPNDPMDALLPDTLDEFHYNSLVRFLYNRATPEETDIALKTMFVLTVFNPRP